MNVVEMLSKELRDKHFTDFERVRYIYIRCCQIFSFDARWNYFTLYDEEFTKEIERKYIDVENVKSPLVVCHSHSKHVLKSLIERLTSADVRVVGSIDDGHSFVSVTFGKDAWNLDATYGDFSRVKMGLAPTGFQHSSKEVSFEDLDREIGFTFHSDDEYKDLDSSNGYNFMGEVAHIISTSKCKYYYSDVAFLYSYLTHLCHQKSFTRLDNQGELYRFIHFFQNGEDYVLAKQNGEYALQLSKRVTR